MINKKNLLHAMVAAISFSCNYQRAISVPKPQPYPTDRPAEMVAGIAQTDLTLPPGYPMAGYSINGRIARGYWVRPKATALYLRDTGGTPFVFVATDLWAVTAAQKMAVLKILSEDDNTNFIGENELLLSATHTHHSAGAIEFDQAFASTSIGFGFDPAAFAFIIRQIAAAIKGAVGSAIPANLSYTVATVNGIAKNRSLNAYMQNSAAERQTYLRKIQIASNRFYRSPEEIASAIDQQLTVLTVKNKTGKIKGIFASYPMHPTATGDATEVYSADVFGLAANNVSLQMDDHPLVAFYNGAEGDVAPDYMFHQRFDAVRIADSLSEAVIRASRSEKQLSLNGPIEHRTTTINIASQVAVPDKHDSKCYNGTTPRVKTAEQPVVGASVFAGASDGRTSLSSFGISDGVTQKEWHAEQGHKMPAVAFLMDNVWKHVLPKPIRYLAKRVAKIKPRSTVQISLHTVGNVCFAGLPGELTTMMGRRIKNVLAMDTTIGKRPVSLVGMADAYISYVTTPCEYQAQYYEGASTFYGHATGPVLVEAYKKLAMQAPDSVGDRKKKFTFFNGGKAVEFGPQFLGKLQTWNAEEGLHNLLVSANGYKVYIREIPPENESDEVLDIHSTEVISFSFTDRVNPIQAADFYPRVSLQTADGSPTDLPEHILTVDQFNEDQSVWSVRIVNTSLIADGKERRIIITPLSGNRRPTSGLFRINGFGIR